MSFRLEESDLSAVQAVEAHKDLSEIERSFRELKDLVEMRPMHVVDNRVGAEIRRGVTAGNHQARQILAALAISDREPPLTQSSEKMPASDKVEIRRLIFKDFQS